MLNLNSHIGENMTKKVTFVMENTKFDTLRYEVSYNGRESQLDKLIEMYEINNPDYSVISVEDGWESEDEDY